LSQLGTAILGGAVTTVGSVVFLWPCYISLFVQLGVMIFANMLIAVFMTFLFLAPLLMVAGPSGHGRSKGSIYSMLFCRPCRRYRKKQLGRSTSDLVTPVASGRATPDVDVSATDRATDRHWPNSSEPGVAAPQASPPTPISSSRPDADVVGARAEENPNLGDDKVVDVDDQLNTATVVPIEPGMPRMQDRTPLGASLPPPPVMAAIDAFASGQDEIMTPKTHVSEC